MSKCINSTIKVELRGNYPSYFIYRKRYQVSEVQDCWRESGQWWLGEPERHVFKVLAPANLCELHFFPATEKWLLYKIQD